MAPLVLHFQRPPPGTLGAEGASEDHPTRAPDAGPGAGAPEDHQGSGQALGPGGCVKVLRRDEPVMHINQKKWLIWLILTTFYFKIKN